MKGTEENNYDELLDYSLKMLHRGDSMVSISNFLVHKNASEEEQKSIFSVIREEKNKTKNIDRKAEDKLEKDKFIKNSLLQIVIAIVVIIVSGFLYSKGLDVNEIMFIPLIALIGGIALFLINCIKICVALFLRKN